MKHPFKVAMTALAMCIATHAFATEGNAELQSETTLAQELNLSSAQVEQIKGLREQATKELSSVKLDAIGQDVIVNMIKSGKVGRSGGEKQLQTISDVQAEARYYRAHYLFAEVSRVLTARAESQAARDAEWQRGHVLRRLALTRIPASGGDFAFFHARPLTHPRRLIGSLLHGTRMSKIRPQNRDNPSPSCPTM